MYPSYKILVSDTPFGLFGLPRGEPKLLGMLILHRPWDPSHLEALFLTCDLYSHCSISVWYLIQHSGFAQCCTFLCKAHRCPQTILVLLNEWAWTLLSHFSESFPHVLLVCVSIWMWWGGGRHGIVLTRLTQVWVSSQVSLGATGSYSRSDRPACAVWPQDQTPVCGPVPFNPVDVALKADHRCAVGHAMAL